MDKEAKDLSRGRSYVLRLLKIRLRSEKEIRDKLKAKKYAAVVIEDLLAYFKGLGYINDFEFARAWVNSRLSRPLGYKMIGAELKDKGIPEEIIDALIREKKSTVSESGIVRELAARRWNRLREAREPADKIKPKLYAYLLRRGFSYEVVAEEVRKLT